MVKKQTTLKQKRTKRTKRVDNIVKLPPFKITKVVASLSQVEGWNISKLNVPKTWSITQGEDITVMVIDTGYSDHSDLEEGIQKDKCRSFLSVESFIEDKNGHSTHCQGIIGARNNNSGMVGVAPKCNIITCKVLGKDGTGGMDGIRKALQYAIEIKPDIISMSLGSPVPDGIMHALIQKLYKMNIPVIAAAGNDGKENAVNYPGRYPECICVTAFDENGNPAKFNSTGEEVGVSAPGVDIYSTWLNNQYAKLSGTSMATPFVAGTIALLLAKHRKQERESGSNDCLTIDQIKEHITKYSDDKGIVGKDSVWGYGMINPEKLIIGENGAIPGPIKPEPTPRPAPRKKTFIEIVHDFFKKIF